MLAGGALVSGFNDFAYLALQSDHSSHFLVAGCTTDRRVRGLQQIAMLVARLSRFENCNLKRRDYLGSLSPHDDDDSPRPYLAFLVDRCISHHRHHQ